MKRRITYILFIFIIAAGLLSGCSEKGEITEPVTRGEWISMLSEAFALDTHNSDSPYYSDIDSGNDFFPYVQASAEWGVLSIFNDNTLNADLPVTRDEVASTVAIAAGFLPNGEGEFDTEASIDYAIEYGIIDEAGKNHITENECASIIEAAQNLYLANPGEEKMVVEYADDLVDLRGMSTPINFAGEDEIVFPASLRTADSATIMINGQAVQISVGNTFLAPATEESPVGAAYKVVSMREENGQVIFSITAPNFGDIYDCVDIHTTVSLSDDAIVWADGVKVSSLAPNELSSDKGGYSIQLLSDRKSNGSAMDPSANSVSYHWRRRFNSGVKQIYQDIIPNFLGNGPEVQALKSSNFIYNTTPSLGDFNGSLQGWTKELEKVNKYEDGYDITIDLGVQLAAIVDVSYYKFVFLTQEIELWPESVSMTLHSNVTADFSMEGSIGEDKKLELGKITIPVGQTGFTVDGYLFLYLEATGEVEIKLEIENTNRVGWNIKEGQQGYQSPVRKRPGLWGNTFTAEATGAIDLSTGIGSEIDLSAFSTVKLIGADCKVGGDLEAKGTLTGECSEQTADGVTTRHYAETIELGSTFYLPVSSITVSGPDELSDILGTKKSWEIVSKENANKIPFVSARWMIWEKTVRIGEIDYDFSPYIGTYVPYKLSEGQTASILNVNDDGSIWGESGYSGGGVTFSNPLSGNGIEPISIIIYESGAIECILVSEDFNTTTEDGMARVGYRIRYLIYPPGIVQDENGVYESWLDETKDKTRILYLEENNGVQDIRYCQSKNEEKANEDIDISLYAGTYEPYARGYGVVSNLSYASLILGVDGSLQGEYTYSSETVNFTTDIAGSNASPISIDYQKDGTIHVVLLSSGNYEVSYILVPPNVDISGYISIGVDPQENREKARIVYIEGEPGTTTDIYYYQT